MRNVNQAQSTAKLSPRRTEAPEWVVNNVTVTPRKKSFNRCYWDQEALEKQHLSKKYTGLQQTQQLCSNKRSQGIGNTLTCRENRKGQIQLNFAVRLNHETAPCFHWGPGLSGALAEKQCSSLQLGLLEFWREHKTAGFCRESHWFRSPDENCILCVQCILVQMFLSRKYSVCTQTICRVTKELFEKQIFTYKVVWKIYNSEWKQEESGIPWWHFYSNSNYSCSD